MACCDTNGCSVVDKCYSHSATTACTSCNTAQSDEPCSTNCGSHNTCTSANDYACSTNGSYCNCYNQGKCAMNCSAQNINDTNCVTNCQSHFLEFN